MTPKEIATIATDIIQDYEYKSFSWRVSRAADTCECEFNDVIDALLSFPEISGFREVEK